MKNYKTIILKWGGMVASLALVLGVSASNAACVWFWHQPKVPQGMDKFKK